MIGGSVIVGLCLIVLGWTSEIVGMFVSDTALVGANFHLQKGVVLIILSRNAPVPLHWPFSASMLWTSQSMQASLPTPSCKALFLWSASAIFLSQLDRGYSAHSKTAAWICLG